MPKTPPGSVGWTPQSTAHEPNLHLLDDDEQTSSAIRALFRLSPRPGRSSRSWRARYEALSPELRRVVDLYLAADDARRLLERLGFNRLDESDARARTCRELARALEAPVPADSADSR